MNKYLDKTEIVKVILTISLFALFLEKEMSCGPYITDGPAGASNLGIHYPCGSLSKLISQSGLQFFSLVNLILIPIIFYLIISLIFSFMKSKK